MNTYLKFKKAITITLLVCFHACSLTILKYLLLSFSVNYFRVIVRMLKFLGQEIIYRNGIYSKFVRTREWFSRRYHSEMCSKKVDTIGKEHIKLGRLIVVKNVGEDVGKRLHQHLRNSFMRLFYQTHSIPEYYSSKSSVTNFYIFTNDIGKCVTHLKKLFPPHNRHGIGFEVLSPLISKYFFTNFKFSLSSTSLEDILNSLALVFIYQMKNDFKATNLYHVRLKYAQDAWNLIDRLLPNDVKAPKCNIIETMHNPNLFYHTNKLLLKNVEKNYSYFYEHCNNDENTNLLTKLKSILKSNVSIGNQGDGVFVEVENEEKFDQFMRWNCEKFFFEPYFDRSCSSQTLLHDQLWLSYNDPKDIVPTFNHLLPEGQLDSYKLFTNFHPKNKNYAIVRVKNEDVDQISSKNHLINTITLPKRNNIFSNHIIIDDKFYGTEMEDIVEFLKPYKYHDARFEMVDGNSIVRVAAKNIPSYYGILHSKCVDRKDTLVATPARFTPFYRHYLTTNRLFNDYYFWVDYSSIVFNVNSFSSKNAQKLVQHTIDHIIQECDLKKDADPRGVNNSSSYYRIKYVKEGNYQTYTVVVEFDELLPLAPELAIFSNGQFNNINSIEPVAFWNSSANRGIPCANEFIIGGLPEDVNLTSYLNDLFSDLEFHMIEMSKKNDGTYRVAVSSPKQIDMLLSKNFYSYDKYFNLIINQHVCSPKFLLQSHNHIASNTFCIKNDDISLDLSESQMVDWLHPLIPKQIVHCSLTNSTKVTVSDENEVKKLLFKSGKIHNDFGVPLFVRFCPAHHENYRPKDAPVCIDQLNQSSKEIMLVNLFQHSFPPKNPYALGSVPPPLALAILPEVVPLTDLETSIVTQAQFKLKDCNQEKATKNNQSSKVLYAKWKKRPKLVKEANDPSQHRIINSKKPSIQDQVDVSRSHSSLRFINHGYPKILKSGVNLLRTDHYVNEIDRSFILKGVTFTHTTLERAKPEVLDSATRQNVNHSSINKEVEAIDDDNTNLIVPAILSRIKNSNVNLPEQYHFLKLEANVSPKAPPKKPSHTKYETSNPKGIGVNMEKRNKKT